MANNDKRRDSVRIKKGSWLKNCRLARLDDDIVAWADFNRPTFSEREGDIFYRVERTDRPETVANRFYGNESLWWVIAIANDIEVPLIEFYPGAVLRIPEPEFILRKVNSSAEL